MNVQSTNFSRLLSLPLSLIIIYLTSISLASEGNSPSDCSSTLSDLQTKSDNLAAALISLDSLIESKGPVEVPLTILFQANLADEDSIKKRIAELSQQTESGVILDQDEYKNYEFCAKDKKSQNLVSQVAEKQATLNTKRLNFLKREKSVRDNLIATFEAARQKELESYQIEKQLSESKVSIGKAQAGLMANEKSMSN